MTSLYPLSKAGISTYCPDSISYNTPRINMMTMLLSINHRRCCDTGCYDTVYDTWGYKNKLVRKPQLQLNPRPQYNGMLPKLVLNNPINSPCSDHLNRLTGSCSAKYDPSGLYPSNLLLCKRFFYKPTHFRINP